MLYLWAHTSNLITKPLSVYIARRPRAAQRGWPSGIRHGSLTLCASRWHGLMLHLNSYRFSHASLFILDIYATHLLLHVSWLDAWYIVVLLLTHDLALDYFHDMIDGLIPMMIMDISVWDVVAVIISYILDGWHGGYSLLSHVTNLCNASTLFKKTVLHVTSKISQ